MKTMNVDNLIKKAISEVITPETVKEAYVAEPKQYRQTTDYLTQKNKDAHLELYNQYIKDLNNVSAKLDTADRENANSNNSNFRSFKLDETYNCNAVWLHELHFANCFDPHSEIFMDSISYLRLERDFGSFENWQEDFIACGMACGEGWVVTGYNMFLKRYVNTIVSHHSCDVMMGLYPTIVLDCWSHAYYKDYLNDKKSYIMTQMREFNWEIINERFTKSESIAEVLKK